MNEYLNGEKLYGDDFTSEQIRKWYEEESEGYSDLGSKDKSKYKYNYHEINKLHGFNKFKSDHFENVLGFGSAWGYEFEPIIRKIENLTIVEPSNNLRNNKIGVLVPNYVKPEINGRLTFKNDSFDLITCFGTLHHIPNVSFVIRELIRVLKPGGYLLIREPIISMGDWNLPRSGLTKNERGIPVLFFEKIFNEEPVVVISREYCFTITSLIQRTIGKLFKTPVYAFKLYVLFDKIFSASLKWNVKYYAVNKMNRISPSSVFYVIRKSSAGSLN